MATARITERTEVSHSTLTAQTSTARRRGEAEENSCEHPTRKNSQDGEHEGPRHELGHAEEAQLGDTHLESREPDA